ncbi:MAG: flagellar biosynthesis repressor FlbT [Alphaproteobacteria bacterium]|nr:flagellar biosynthesis repressor FlbT [Alphaproteobacteria bacterium]
MALKLVLKPGERVVINQAVIINGKDKAELVLENRAALLREKDIMTERAADSPAKRIYFLVQMLYLFPEKTGYQEKFNSHLREFLQAVPSATPLALEIGEGIVRGNHYSALKSCRKLIAYEQEVLKNVAGKR